MTEKVIDSSRLCASWWLSASCRSEPLGSRTWGAVSQVETAVLENIVLLLTTSHMRLNCSDPLVSPDRTEHRVSLSGRITADKVLQEIRTCRRSETWISLEGRVWTYRIVLWVDLHSGLGSTKWHIWNTSTLFEYRSKQQLHDTANSRGGSYTCYTCTHRRQHTCTSSEKPELSPRLQTHLYCNGYLEDTNKSICRTEERLFLTSEAVQWFVLLQNICKCWCQCLGLLPLLLERAAWKIKTLRKWREFSLKLQMSLDAGQHVQAPANTARCRETAQNGCSSETWKKNRWREKSRVFFYSEQKGLHLFELFLYWEAGNQIKNENEQRRKKHETKTNVKKKVQVWKQKDVATVSQCGRVLQRN